MTIKSYRKLLQDAKKSVTYKIEKAKLDFVVAMNSLIAEKEITKRVIADRLGCTAPNVSQLLRGDGNFTLETMVKLADAVDGDIHIHIARRDSKVRWVEALASRRLEQTPICAQVTVDTREAWKHCANLH